MRRLLMCSVEPPVLVTVTVWAGLSVPTTRLPKLMLAGETEAVAGIMPVPESDTLAEIPLSESAPVRVPVVLGEKVTFTMQLCPAGNPAPQVLLCAKSPVIASVTFRQVLPVAEKCHRLSVAGRIHHLIRK